MLLAAESPGRRELLLDLLRPHRHRAQDRRRLGRVSRRRARSSRSRWRRSPPASRSPIRHHDLRRGAALRRARAPGAAPATQRPRPGAHHPAARRSAPRCTGRARGLRRRPLPRPDDDGRGRHDGRVPRARVRRRRQAVRARPGARARQPLHRCAGGNRAAAQARRRPMAEGARSVPPARIRDAAAELLDVYSRRATRPGIAFPVDEQQLQAFEAGFPFEETADQARRSAQVIDDLRAPRPMDRVVCGDVGFGKTEVALRAAFVAVQAGTAGRRARAHDAARAAALPDLRRPLRRLARQGRAAVALPRRRAIEGDARRPGAADRSTSSSARTGCCSRACASRTWAS